MSPDENALEKINERGIEIAEEIDDGVSQVLYPDWVLARLILWATDMEAGLTPEEMSFHTRDDYRDEMRKRRAS